MQQTKLIALLPDLANFILVVQEGSFTAAAKRLELTPSALSKLITRLERSLNVKLFDRNTRRLMITPVGKRVYDQSVIMLNSAQTALELCMDNHDAVRGAIVIAAPEAFLNTVLQPFVIPFLNQYPEVELKLRAIDGDFDLLKAGVDVAFRLTDKPDEHLVSRELCKTNLVLCANPDYLDYRGTPHHPTELATHDCLYLAENERDYIWRFEKGQERHTVSVSGRYAVNQSLMRLNGVKAGLGIGIFHDFVVQDAIREKSVIPVLPDWHIKSYYHGAITIQYAQNQYMPARLKVFIDFMAKAVTHKLTQ